MVPVGGLEPPTVAPYHRTLHFLRRLSVHTSIVVDGSVVENSTPEVSWFLTI